jgi:hypothetical protein
MAAAVHRNAIEGELQRFTLRVTRRTVPFMFSMMLVQASERRSSADLSYANPPHSPDRDNRDLIDAQTIVRIGSRGWRHLQSAEGPDVLFDHLGVSLRRFKSEVQQCGIDGMAE